MIYNVRGRTVNMDMTCRPTTLLTGISVYTCRLNRASARKFHTQVVYANMKLHAYIAVLDMANLDTVQINIESSDLMETWLSLH